VEALWSNLSRRGQALLTRVTNVASTAWNTLQNRWSALQRTASALVAGLRTRVDSAVGALQGLATAAWTGLQGAATQAWNGVKGVATSAWTALGTRATAAWTGLKSAATTAWTALQSLTGISVSGLAAKVQGIISRISGVVSGIIDRILNAVQSLLSRVRRATSAALDGLRTRASAAWSTLKNFGTRAWEGVKSLGTRAYEGVKELGTRAWERVKDLGTRAWEGLQNLGTRAWNGLKDLGQRAWNGLKSGWEWLKGRAEAAWKWIKGAWERVKRAVSQFWDWVKRKAREAFAWMKQKWEWLKGLVRRALAWLKAKWEWLKRKVKITIRIRDLELMGVKNFKPWKFVDRESPRVPIVKAPIETPIGPIVLSAFVQGKMEATIAGSVGPITLKNTTIVLQPLASRYTGKTDLHVPGKAVETLTLTGLIGGEANYMGAFGIVEGGLQGTGTATGFGAATFSPRIVYDSGNISLTQRILLEFCLGAVIVLDAIARVKVGAAAPGGGGGGGGGLLPSAPSPLPRLPGSGFGGGGGTSGGGGSSAPFARLPGTSGEAVSQVEPCKEATDGEPAEKVLWEGRWNLGRWTTQECWKTKAGFQLHSSGSALPDLDVNFDVNPVPLSAVLSNMFAKPPGMTAVSGGGAPGSPAPAPCVNAPKCGKTESKTPKGTLTPSKGKFAGKTIGFQQKSNKHTKVADCSVSQLQAAMKLDPAKLEGELAKFVKDCQDGKRPPSQIGSESFGNYGNLVLDAIENGDPDDAFLTTASNAGVAGSKCNKTDKYRVHDDAVEDGKGRPIPPDQQQFHLFPVP